MADFCVSYDLVEPHDKDEKNYEKVRQVIKSLGVATEVTRSTWMLKSGMLAKEIRAYITEKALGEGDRLFVCEVSNWSSINAMSNDGLKPFQS